MSPLVWRPRPNLLKSSPSVWCPRPTLLESRPRPNLLKSSPSVLASSADLAGDVTVGVASLAEPAGDVTAGVLYLAELAEVVTASVASSADLSKCVTAGVASLADFAEVVTIGVTFLADLAGDVTARVASLADLAEVVTADVAPSADPDRDVTAGVTSVEEYKERDVALSDVVLPQTDPDESSAELETIVVGDVGTGTLWFLTGWAEGTEIEFMIDTGCQATSVFEQICVADPRFQCRGVTDLHGVSPDVLLSSEPLGHADHTGITCRCRSSDQTGAYVHAVSAAHGDPADSRPPCRVPAQFRPMNVRLRPFGIQPIAPG